MTRLIDADALDYLTHRECIGHGEYYDMEIVTKVRIDNAPTIDAVEVVRCKDCKHYDQAWDKRGACFNSKGVFGILNDDDYCSYGERREP